MTTLWHFTCEHGHAALGPAGIVKPAMLLTPAGTDVPMQGMFAWYTDLENPDPLAVGLTSVTLRCNRMAHRYRVTDDADVLPWSDYAKFLPELDRTLATPGAQPDHWWAASAPVPVEYDPVRNRQPRKALR